MNEPPQDFPSEAASALERGSKIEAIKCVRIALGIGLKESKELVEGFIEKRPDIKSRMDAANAESAATALRWLFMLAAIAAAVYFFWGRSW